MTEPEQFGRYQLIRVVGTGGMAQVHLARQVGPQNFVKPCVLKRISPEHAHDSKVRKMFLDEARLSALLNHPHIVQTFDFGEVGDVPFMAMELVDGVNLSQLCRTLATNGVWLPLYAALEIALAVAEALDYAHTLKDLDGGKPLQVVHRDVSPQNILVSRQGSVKLADFGIARHENRENKTVGVATKGKPGYMAPEQAFSEALDGRADLFSLGIVLVELVSARRVMRAVNDMITLPKRVEELIALQPGAPAGLLNFLLSLTAMIANDRPKSARAAAATLRSLLTEVHEPTTLGAFLETVFAQFFPTDPSSGRVAMVGKTDLSMKTIDPKATLSMRKGTAMPAPPSSESQDLAFADTDWVQQSDEAEENTAAAIYGGWPAEYIEKDPGPQQIELVSRSSSVDAMQFFGAQGTSKPPPAEAEEEKTRAGTAEGPVGPIFGPGAGTSPLLPRGLPKVLLGIEDEEAKRAAAEKRKKMLLYVQLVAAGLAISGLSLGVITMINRMRGRNAEAPSDKTGKLTVVSTMRGARVLIDGLETPSTTPAEIDGLPLGKAVRVAVRLPGYLSIPSEVAVIIPETTQKTGVTFVMRKGRVFQLETTPEGATVSVNGRQLSEVTPLSLPPIILGSTATLAISLQGFLPVTLTIPARAETATVSTVKLEPAKEIDVVSEPAGARVFIDSQERGVTPVYDLLVPASRKFKIKAVKKGFKPWTQAFKHGDLRERLVEVDLEPVPLLAMPMSTDERKEAKDWDRRLTRLSGDVRRAKGRVTTAEKRLEQVEAQPNFFVGRLTSAQREVDEARVKLEELETELGEVESQVDTFRQKVMNRLEGLNEEN